MPRTLGRSWGGFLFVMSEVPLYLADKKPPTLGPHGCFASSCMLSKYYTGVPPSLENALF